MFEDDRIKENYKGFDLVAKPGAPKAAGRASHQITLKKFSATGVDVAAVLAELRALVDKDVAENRELYREAVARKHQEFLSSLAKLDKGRGKVSRWPRASNCYNCKGPVANIFDLECLACGWIVCNYCAACGCGYGGNATSGTHL